MDFEIAVVVVVVDPVLHATKIPAVFQFEEPLREQGPAEHVGIEQERIQHRPRALGKGLGLFGVGIAGPAEGAGVDVVGRKPHTGDTDGLRMKL